MGINLFQISSLLLRQPNEESGDEWVVQWNGWRDLLPLLLIEATHGAIPVAPLLASGEAQVVFSQLHDATLVDKSCYRELMHLVSLDRVFEVECHATEALDNGGTHGESERLFTTNA